MIIDEITLGFITGAVIPTIVALISYRSKNKEIETLKDSYANEDKNKLLQFQREEIGKLKEEVKEQDELKQKVLNMSFLNDSGIGWGYAIIKAFNDCCPNKKMPAIPPVLHKEFNKLKGIQNVLEKD